MIINFENLIGTSNNKILSGREFGKSSRKKYDLDSLDKSTEIINIKIPEKIIAINSSFFLGMFDKSIINLGEEEFRNKYIFDCSNSIKRSIDDGIRRALKVNDSLDFW